MAVTATDAQDDSTDDDDDVHVDSDSESESESEWHSDSLLFQFYCQQAYSWRDVTGNEDGHLFDASLMPQLEEWQPREASRDREWVIASQR